VSVTVVIATRDRATELSRTLDKLAALPERPATIVVDNGSRDQTPQVAARRSGVAYLRLSGNAGAAARTIGAVAAITPYVAFADDDSWWAPGALRRAASHLERHPRLAVVAARLLVGPEARLDPTCERMRDSPLRRGPGLPGPAVLGFVACAAVVRRSAFLAVGGFHPRFGFGAEEALVSIDLAAAGWDLAYLEDVVAHHHPARATRPGRRRTTLRNEVWIAWLRLPGRDALRRLRGIARAGAPGSRAIAGALAGLPWVLRERHAVSPELARDLRRLTA